MNGRNIIYLYLPIAIFRCSSRSVEDVPPKAGMEEGMHYRLHLHKGNRLDCAGRIVASINEFFQQNVAQFRSRLRGINEQGMALL